MKYPSTKGTNLKHRQHISDPKKPARVSCFWAEADTPPGGAAKPLVEWKPLSPFAAEIIQVFGQPPHPPAAYGSGPSVVICYYDPSASIMVLFFQLVNSGSVTITAPGQAPQATQVKPHIDNRWGEMVEDNPTQAADPPVLHPPGSIIPMCRPQEGKYNPPVFTNLLRWFWDQPGPLWSLPIPPAWDQSQQKGVFQGAAAGYDRAYVREFRSWVRNSPIGQPAPLAPGDDFFCVWEWKVECHSISLGDADGNLWFSENELIRRIITSDIKGTLVPATLPKDSDIESIAMQYGSLLARLLGWAPFHLDRKSVV
jgi:hypothetical protein